jgi:hypothetical protein
VIVVTIEMWPGGDKSRKHELGRTYVFNDAAGTASRGNYEVRVCRKGSFDADPREIVEGTGFTRKGRVDNWPRKSYNIWRLVLRCLQSAFPEEK